MVCDFILNTENKNKQKKFKLSFFLSLLLLLMIDSFVVPQFIAECQRDRSRKYIVTDRREIGRFGCKGDAPVSGLEKCIRPPVLRPHVPLPAFLGEMPQPQTCEKKECEGSAENEKVGTDGNEVNENEAKKDEEVKVSVEEDDIYDENGKDNFGKWIFEAYKAAKGIGRVRLLTWRNNLNKIASTPYSIDEEWIINVEVCDDGLVRFGIYETAAHRDWEENAPEFVRKCMYWGRTFEDVMADSGQPGCRTKFCTVIRLDLAGIPAVVGAEMDCCDERTGEYTELKTHSLSADLPLQKLRKIWIQSYIAGVRHVYVGHRDKYGMVRAIRDLEVSWIPDITRARTARPTIPSDRDEVWDPAVCMSFMSNCISWILRKVSEHEKETKHFHVHYTPADARVTISKGLFSYKNIELAEKEKENENKE